MANVARLLFEDGSRAPVEIGQECGLGRDSDNAVVLGDDATVSRQHARIRRRDAALVLVDLGTRNGTFLERDGERLRVTELTLSEGDLISIGTARLRVELDPPGDETRILEQGLTQVPGATRVGRILPGVPPDPQASTPPEGPDVEAGGVGVPATQRPSWIRRLLGRGRQQ